MQKQFVILNIILKMLTRFEIVKKNLYLKKIDILLIILFLIMRTFSLKGEQR